MLTALNPIMVNILCTVIVFAYLGDEYTFYYESRRYPLTNDSHPSNFNILLAANLSLDITLNSDRTNFLYINKQPLISAYDDDNEYNEIQSFDSSARRRLRSCHWNHCWWGRCHKHHYHCNPTSPPKNNAYWNKKYQRKGRFIAFFPGYRQYTYAQCSHHCRVHYGGLASIASAVEQQEVAAVCKDILEQPTASPTQNYAGNWRGSACYIGLQRPFALWDDQKKVDKGIENWSPGQPDNAGKKENCGEIWPFKNGVWNDIACDRRKSCICEDARGVFSGKYIAVQAMRDYHSAEQHCQETYGTTLATIVNDEENNQVLEACKKIIIVGTTASCWIGLQRPFYRWNDGSDAEEKYTNWKTGEPNNKNEKCSELYTIHEGKWNDLPCRFYRYFVCNALSSIERMGYHGREELIAKRLHRHRIKWEHSQARVHREKLSKMFFSQIRELRAQMAKSKRTHTNKYREELRKHLFNNLYPGVPYSSFGKSSQIIMNSARLFGGSRLAKQARHRRGILKHKKEKKQSDIAYSKDKMQRRKQDMYVRRMVEFDDEVTLFGNDGIENDEIMDDEYGDTSARKCIMVSVMNEMYEICVGENYIDIKRYIKKIKEKKERMVDFEAESMAENNIMSDQNYSVEVMSFIDFENWKYEKIFAMELEYGNESGINIMKHGVNNYLTHYVKVYQKIYDNDSNHQMQCWSDIKPFHLCMEIDNDNMVISTKEYDVFRDPFIKFEFNNDKYWDDIIYHYGMDDRQIAMQKCRKFYSTNSKLCVLKTVDNVYKMILIRHRDDDPSFYD